MRVVNERNYNLLRELVITDFKLRYQNSVLGYFWSLAKPMMLFGVLYIVFTQVFNFGDKIPYYPVYLLLGIVLWTYFVEATTMGLGSIVGRGDLIRKVSMPKYIIVLSTSFSAFINLMFNLAVVGVFMVAMHVPLHFRILYLPLFLLELLILSTATSFLLSALYVKFRDIAYIWEVILQILFYATPIIYPMQFVTEKSLKYAQIISLSPLAQIIQDARYVVVTHAALRPAKLLPAPWGLILHPATVIILVILTGLYFRRSSQRFAEDI